MPRKQIPTPRYKKILQRAEIIARKMKHVNWVGSEHLLLAIFELKEGDGLGKQMLTASGADEKKARECLENWGRTPL